MASPPYESQNDFERCADLREWRLTHAGDLPNRRSDNIVERSLAIWLSKALQRRKRQLTARPSQRKLTTDESFHLDSTSHRPLPVLLHIGQASAHDPGSASSDPAAETPVDVPAPVSICDGTSAAVVSNKRLQRHQEVPIPETPSKRPCTTSSNGLLHNNMSTLSLRGLNIQWPFSQLMLMGAKSEEVRRYELNYRGIAKTDEEVWIVETKGLAADASANAMVSGLQIAPRPSSPQVVGTVRFAGAHSYGSKKAFDDARVRHRIAVGSKHDWDGSGSVYGWRVGTVRALREPVPVGSTGQVCFAERSFSVCFATTDSQHDLLTPPTAWRKPTRPVEAKAKVDTSAAVDAGDEKKTSPKSFSVKQAQIAMQMTKPQL